jgi:hypothetical protein
MAAKEIASKVHKIVPPMLESFHKGELPEKRLARATDADFTLQDSSDV